MVFLRPLGLRLVDDRWHLLPKDATLESVPNSDDVIIPLA
ncbi:hypothetical protein NB836_033210, partial [Pseudomonas aeruginosa]|nr:hypothetical protein [Pseudomonas aeruginosa]